MRKLVSKEVLKYRKCHLYNISENDGWDYVSFKASRKGRDRCYCNMSGTPSPTPHRWNLSMSRPKKCRLNSTNYYYLHTSPSKILQIWWWPQSWNNAPMMLTKATSLHCLHYVHPPIFFSVCCAPPAPLLPIPKLTFRVPIIYTCTIQYNLWLANTAMLNYSILFKGCYILHKLTYLVSPITVPSKMFKLFCRSMETRR